MTTANPPAPSAQVLFFSSRQHPLQSRSHTTGKTGRLSTWPFKVTRDKGAADGLDIRAQAARVLQTTAAHWWPPEA
ncbi:hypothetical protein CY658_29750 [Variovorax sp. RO1]|uniref:hypothetical protein n=1 Tax=Variovorax sp. RO1 TaxID=2066034 RepID=UPI000C7185CE|nr:hypothetical protein [Variovorax sp. RO1]PLC01723.1 hypothetical protein CY658_29750 [Variovorax sp. RO1]